MLKRHGVQIVGLVESSGNAEVANKKWSILGINQVSENIVQEI